MRLEDAGRRSGAVERAQGPGAQALNADEHHAGHEGESHRRRAHGMQQVLDAVVRTPAFHGRMGNAATVVIRTPNRP